MMQSRYKAISYAFIASLFFWVIDAFIDTLFHYDEQFLDVLLFNKREIFFRILVMAGFITFGVFLSNAYRRQGIAERQTHEAKEMYQKIVEDLPDLICRYTPDTTITFVNESYARCFGKRIEELIGNSFLELIPPEYHNYIRSKITSLNESSPITSTEYKILSSDGKERWQLWRDRALFDISGKIIEIQSIGQDITERKEAEYELSRHRENLTELVEQRTAEALQVAHLASVGKLAAGVAHEINNPINGVINYAQILADKMLNGSKEEDIAQRILKEGNRIAKIVHTLLTFTRHNIDKKIPVNVNDIISETLTLTITQLQKDNIHVDINIPENLPRILANPQQLQQVFLNILYNAKYALNQKYPNLHEYKKIEIRGDGKVTMKDTPYVQISFLDYGTGISPDNLNKVVIPFFTTKPSGVGTGLGLSISDNLIKDHGGSMKLESKQGEFTKVLIDLPVIDKDEKNI